MKRIIFGLTDLADVLFYELVQEEIEIDAFCVNKEYLKEKKHMGKPVIAFEEVENTFVSEEIGIYVCIGYHSMNKVRAHVFELIEKTHMQILSFVHPSALVMGQEMGKGCLVFEHAVIGPYAKIGQGNIFYPKSMVCHHSIVGDFNFFAVSSSVAGNVQIGNNCFIGNNVTTKDGIKISDYTLAGAGSYVGKDTQKESCIVPAKSVELSNHTSLDFL